MSLRVDLVDKLARLVTEYCVGIRKGDEVSITGGIEALPLIRSIYREVVARRGYPVIVVLRDEILDEIFYKYAEKDLLEHVSPIEEAIVKTITVSINILSPSHTKYLSDVDPERTKIRSRARYSLHQIFLERSAKGQIRWTVVPYPTRALAQEAGMSMIEYEDFVYRALMLDKEDPVKAWISKAREQDKIALVLSKGREINIEGPGVKLYAQIAGRKWVNDDGKHNMPGGEVFTAPIEDSVEGYIEFDYPAIWRGVEVDGIKLVFKKGEVVESRAIKREDFLRQMLTTDEGARRVGELAFGLNYSITRFTKEILFDEKIGGTMHLALGSSYPETGGRNKSSIHWDMIKNLKKHQVYLDGDLIYENGKFILDVL